MADRLRFDSADHAVRVARDIGARPIRQEGRFYVVGQAKAEAMSAGGVVFDVLMSLCGEVFVVPINQSGARWHLLIQEVPW